MDNEVAAVPLESRLPTQGLYEIGVITRGEYNVGLHNSSKTKSSSFHTPFLAGFLWLMVH